MEGPKSLQKKFFSMTSFLRCLFLSAGSMLLFCLGFLVPPIGVAAVVFSPTPMALLGARENKTWMMLGLFGVTVTLAMVFDWGLALAFLLGYGLLSLGLTVPLGRLEKGSESLLFCSVTSIISKILFVAVNVTLRGVNPFKVDLQALRGALYHMYAGGILSQGGQDAAYFQESLNQAVAIVPYMLPFFIIVYSMFDSLLNYKLCEALQRKQEVTFAPLPPFGEWRFPTSILWMFLFAFILPFLTDGDEWQLGTAMEYNLKFLANVFFFLQGLALVWWGFSKYAARHLFPFALRIILIVFLSMPVLNTWIAALGFGDICFDFRNRKKKIKRA